MQLKKKREKGVCFYFRLLSTKAAATAMMIMTARPIAMYVVVGAELVGGMTTGLGVDATVADGDTGVFSGTGVAVASGAVVTAFGAGVA